MPTLFNIILDNVVQNWIALTVEDKLVAHEGMGITAGQCFGLFYAENGMVGSWDPECLQSALNVIISLFQRYRS